MRHSRLAACVLTFSCLATPRAYSDNWFKVDTDDGFGTLEVDVGSLRWRGDRRELKVRISLAKALRRVNGSYTSVLATLEVRCDSGQSFWRSASFHPDPKAQSQPLATEHYASGLPPSPTPALISEKTWVTLRRSACVHARALQ